ncbi:MAG: sulfur carrier protein ThiS [Lachnospiraceae bacterium]|nr:sulfur carrier protein ThiS [Agathobacter sp.]MDD6291887.1 sulfur carrier protein ThiS [Lachnospiraceae bacterium]
MVHINGKDEAAAGMTVQEYLGKNEYPLEWIVVECNEEIVPKADYATRQLQDGDIVEIVSFVGGG